MLTVKQAANKRRVSEQTIRRWCRECKLGCIDTPNGWAIYPVALKRFKTPKPGRPKGKGKQ